jgi:hypothetical protein
VIEEDEWADGLQAAGWQHAPDAEAAKVARSALNYPNDG